MVKNLCVKNLLFKSQYKHIIKRCRTRYVCGYGMVYDILHLWWQRGIMLLVIQAQEIVRGNSVDMDVIYHLVLEDA